MKKNSIQKKMLTALFVFILGMGLNVQAHDTETNPKLTLDKNPVTGHELVSLIEKQTPLKFAYDESVDKKLEQKITVRKLNTTLADVLQWIKHDANIGYVFAQANFIVLNVIKPKETRPAAAGAISGIVLDETGQPLPGASIRVLETGTGLQTAVDGTYSLSIAAGSYTVEVSFISYQTQRITGVVVSGENVTTLNITLKPAVGKLEEVVITAEHQRESVVGLYAKQKNNTAVTDGISAEQIARTPDNNAAQALRRISGVQISDEKYVVIRGLSDRYNNVMLNGSSVPSTEPNRRNFAFDLVPSALLDEIVINKTGTPDLSGEFAGGLVQVKTRSIPEENFLKVTVGTGYNTQSTGKPMLGLDRGKNAWLGFASPVHQLPKGMSLDAYNKLALRVTPQTPADDPTRQQINQYLGTMPDNWQLKKYTATPMQNYQLQAGRVITMREDQRFGVLGALVYRNDQDIEYRSITNPYANRYYGTDNIYTTRIGGSLNMGYQVGRHKLSLFNTYNRKFSDKLWKYNGVDEDNNMTRHDSYSNVTVINALAQSQLSGEHVIGGKNIKIDWSGSAARLDRDQPWSRVLARTQDGAYNYPKDYFGYGLGDIILKNGNLYYSVLNEYQYNWAANVQIPFQAWKLNHYIKAGYQGRYRTADFSSNIYRMYAFGNPGAYTGLPYENVFNRQQFSSNLYLYPISTSGRDLSKAETSDGYQGFQRLNTVYAMMDIKPVEQLRVVGGMRVENNDQRVFDELWNSETLSYYRNSTVLDETDWLPSVNVIYSVTPKINLRAAWYKTLARPDLREMSSFTYWDYEIFDGIAGDSLKTTRINNMDFRAEFYPGSGEVVSVSLFYKKFRNPIEILYIQTGGGFDLYYQNLMSAQDLGFEIDFRKSLNFISPRGFFSNLYLSGNFTWLNARVKFDPRSAVNAEGEPVSTERNRPLAGQSPYIVNGGLLYAGKKVTLSASYNRYGKRIVFASPNRAVDEYEAPRDMVDLQLSYRFTKSDRAEFKVNVSNLLNQEQIMYKNQFDANNNLGFPQGATSIEPYPGSYGGLVPEQIDPKGSSYNKDYDTVTRRFRFGTSVSISLSYRF